MDRETKKVLEGVMRKRMKLQMVGDTLCAEGRKLYIEENLYTEGDKLRAEGHKLYTEGDNLWKDAVNKHLGKDTTLDWSDFPACRIDGILFDGKESEKGEGGLG